MPARALRPLFATALVVVLVLSLWPLPESSSLGTGWDKADHVVVFVALGLIGLPAWPAHRSRALVGLLGYGALIEVLQGFTVYRQADWHDLVADTIGIGIAALIFAGWRAGRCALGRP